MLTNQSKLNFTAISILLTIIIQLSQNHTPACQFASLYSHNRTKPSNTKPDILSSDLPFTSRLLQTNTRAPIRITFNTTDLNEVKGALNGANQTTTPKLSFIKRALSVAAYFYQTRLKVSQVTKIIPPALCYDFQTSDNDQTYGISNSDLHIYIKYVTDKLITYGATGVQCKTISGRVLPDLTMQQGRPTVGRIIFNTYTTVDKQTTLTNRYFSELTTTAIHEIMHILGFDSSLYNTYLGVDGNTYSGGVWELVQLNSNRLGKVNGNHIIKTPNVLAWARSFYDCSGIQGMALENEETTGVGSHWERLSMYDEIMTATQLNSRKGFSGLSFALLKDMGWYEVDGRWNDTSNYGYHMGCSFYNDACFGGSSYPEYFCDASLTGGVSTCSTNFISKAMCSDIEALMSDGCGMFVGYMGCVDAAQGDDGYKSLTSEKYGTSSFCVQGTLVLNSASSSIPGTYQGRCYPHTCFDTYIEFTINGITTTCTDSEEGIHKTVGGMNGYFICPNFVSFCETSRKTCPNWCSQNGYCTSGICTCLPTHTSASCSVSACPTLSYYNSATSTCSPSCPSGSYVNIFSTTCMLCSVGCGECRDEPGICTGCVSVPSKKMYFVALDSSCVEECPGGMFADGDYCQNCGGNCANCSLTSTNCTSCSSPNFLSTPTWGNCISSCTVDPIYDVINLKCVSTCPENLMLYSGSCSLCPSINDQSCNYCPSSTYKLDSLNCVGACPDKFYANDIKWLCEPCHSSCLRCTSSASNACTACSSSSATKYFMISICVSACPNGYYPEVVNNVCVTCPPALNCEYCGIDNGGNVNCTTCAYGYYFDNGECKEDCATGAYMNGWKRTCDECHESCERCTSPAASSCLECSNLKFLLSNSTGKFCLSSCPLQGYFQSTPNCLSCYPTCLTCSGTSVSSCLTCPIGLYLSSGMCSYICPPSTFVNTVNGKCEACSTGCNFCFGGGIDECSSCGGTLVLDGGSCISKCKNGMAANQWRVCYEELVGLLCLFGLMGILV